MTESIIEHAAKAQYKKQREDWQIWVSWEKLEQRHRKNLIEAMRCAVAAMREPTEKMESAGDREQYEDYRKHSGWNTAKDLVENFDSTIIWRAMIDAALAD